MPLVLNGTTGVQDNSGAFVAGTAVASTSGTSIDFTSIPSWVKRITVMFSGVSTNGTSNRLVQVGSGSVTNTGYSSTAIGLSTSGGQGGSDSTAGYIVQGDSASAITSGTVVITNLSGNIWVSSFSTKFSTTECSFGGGDVTLAGVLDRVRITTVNGTDTFDAGSINILYE